jgi:preprotein translocase subunit SecD
MGAIDENSMASPLPEHNAYGRFIRERGTRRILLAAIVLGLAWYIYSSIHVYLMQQVKWPPLTPTPEGLTVLAVQDKDKPGARKKYVVIEANRAFQFRRPDEETGDGGAGSDAGASDEPEARARGNNPAAAKGVSRGEIVPVETLMQECPAVLNGSHFVGARVEERYEPLFDRQYYAVHVTLSDEGRSRYWQHSRENDQQRLAFILNGEAITCPRIRHMDVSHLTIDPIWVKADAEKLANFINNQKR